MFIGYRDEVGRMALTTDYETVYNSITAPSGPAANLTQVYLVIRADSIVSASLFSPALYAQFHPGWRQKIIQRNQPPAPQELLVRLKKRHDRIDASPNKSLMDGTVNFRRNAG